MKSLGGGPADAELPSADQRLRQHLRRRRLRDRCDARDPRPAAGSASGQGCAGRRARQCRDPNLPRPARRPRVTRAVPLSARQQSRRIRGRMRRRRPPSRRKTMTSTTPTPRRSPLASAAALIGVLLLFGAITFIAGLAIGGSGGPVAQADAAPDAAVRRSSCRPTRQRPGRRRCSRRSPAPSRREAFAVLCDAYAQIQASYVDEITDEQLVDGAVRGMIEYGLEDPYSGYLPPEQYGEALEDLSGEFSGIGAEVGMENLADPADLASCTVVTENCAMVDRRAARRVTGRGGRPAARRPDPRDRRRVDHRRVGELARLRRPGRGRHRRDADRSAATTRRWTSRSPVRSSTSRRSARSCSTTASATSG